MKSSKTPTILLLAWHSAFGQIPTETTAPEIDPAEIVDSKTYDLGDRLFTVQEVTAAVLPTPPPPIAPVPTPKPSVPLKLTTTSRKLQILSLGATIYRSKTGQARSLVHYRPAGTDAVITFWSSADWSLLANVSPIQSSDGQSWQLMLQWSAEDMDQRVALLAKFGKVYQPPQIPNLPAGAAAYAIIEGAATPSMMAPIELFHATYDLNYQQLKAAADEREAARLVEQAKAKEPPPPLKDIVLRFRMLEPGEIAIPHTTPTSPVQ